MSSDEPCPAPWSAMGNFALGKVEVQRFIQPLIDISNPFDL
jgi:hypothetical protein